MNELSLINVIGTDSRALCACRDAKMLLKTEIQRQLHKLTHFLRATYVWAILNGEKNATNERKYKKATKPRVQKRKPNLSFVCCTVTSPL